MNEELPRDLTEQEMLDYVRLIRNWKPFRLDRISSGPSQMLGSNFGISLLVSTYQFNDGADGRSGTYASIEARTKGKKDLSLGRVRFYRDDPQELDGYQRVDELVRRLSGNYEQRRMRRIRTELKRTRDLIAKD